LIMDSNANDPAVFLEDELENIRGKFECGEMQAFGVEQGKILQELQEIRQFQAQLAMKQVSILGETMAKNKVAQEKEQRNRNGETEESSETPKQKEEAMAMLSDTLDSVCRSIAATSQTTRKL